MLIYCHTHDAYWERAHHEWCPDCGDITYPVDVELYDVPLVIWGEEANGSDCLVKCTLVLDVIGDLVEVEVPSKSGKPIVISSRPTGNFFGGNSQLHSAMAEAIWHAAVAYHAQHRWALMDRAGVGSRSVPIIDSAAFRR